MIYTGGFFKGETFSAAFANSDASVGLMYGSVVAHNHNLLPLYKGAEL